MEFCSAGAPNTPPQFGAPAESLLTLMSVSIKSGTSAPLGATLYPDGVNLNVFAKRLRNRR